MTELLLKWVLRRVLKKKDLAKVGVVIDRVRAILIEIEKWYEELSNE